MHQYEHLILTPGEIIGWAFFVGGLCYWIGYEVRGIVAERLGLNPTVIRVPKGTLIQGINGEQYEITQDVEVPQGNTLDFQKVP